MEFKGIEKGELLKHTLAKGNVFIGDFNEGICNYVGDIDNEDLENITTTVINSGILTSKEIELYFRNEILS